MERHVRLFEEYAASDAAGRRSWWHGSREDFDAFDEPQLTASNREHNIPSWWFAEDRGYAERYADVAGGGWMYEVELDLSGALDLSDAAERAGFEAWLVEKGYSGEDIERVFDEQWGVELPYWTNDSALWYAAEEGYSSAYFEEELDGSVRSVAVIGDPSPIMVVGKRRF